MPNRHSAVTMVVGAALIAVPLALAQAPRPGYDDTPMQPDGKWRVHDSRRPVPDVITPGPAVSAAPPGDAVVLLGPSGDLSQWQAVDGSPATWPVSGGVVQSGKGFIRTKATFGDVQLHVEFATPSKVE